MGAIAQRITPPAVVAEQEAECYKLQLEGMTIRQIAERTGLAPSTVHKRINGKCARVSPALEPTEPGIAEQVRTRHLDQIKSWLAKLNEQINRDQYVARNIEVGTRLLEREAKLLGLDAPEKVEATITEVTQEDIALAELVAEAQMQAANTEARIRGEL
jgi:AcrR family transcriptional regulator